MWALLECKSHSLPNEWAHKQSHKEPNIDTNTISNFCSISFTHTRPEYGPHQLPINITDGQPVIFAHLRAKPFPFSVPITLTVLHADGWPHPWPIPLSITKAYRSPHEFSDPHTFSIPHTLSVGFPDDQPEFGAQLEPHREPNTRSIRGTDTWAFVWAISRSYGNPYRITNTLLAAEGP